MKILWVTDIHLKHSNLSITQKLFNFILETLKTNPEIAAIVISGDVNDTKSIIRSECLNQLRNFCKEVLKDAGIRIYFLVGNHDMHSAKDMKFGHSLESLADIEKVTVIQYPVCLQFGNSFIKFVPYTEDNKLLLKELKNEENVNYLFCHNGINGAMMNSKGTYDDSSISADRYANFRRVFVGHYHNYQTFQNVIYLGSPFSHSFNESNVKKYIGIIDTNNGNVSLIEPGLRAHRDFEVNAFDLIAGKESQLDYEEYKAEDLIRIFLTGTKEDNIKAKEFLPKFDNVKVIIKNIDRTEERIKISPEESKQGILSKYVDKVNTGNLDKTRLLEIGKSII